MLVVVLGLCLAVVLLGYYFDKKSKQQALAVEKLLQTQADELSEKLAVLAKRPERLGAILQQVTIAPLTAESLVPMQDIYSSLEGVAVPHGYGTLFTQGILDQATLYLVCRVNGHVVGGAGIKQQVYPQDYSVYSLLFGVVDTVWQRRGLGSLLFLARLASIVPTHPRFFVTLEALPPSIQFFNQLGFQPLQDEGTAPEFPAMGAWFTLQHIKQARALLENHGIHLPQGTRVPPLRRGG
jgi:predicted N-acetyltransferase YhbS